jgi:hypothetical protein
VVFEAILFLAGAMLFFLAVLFFVFLWQDRTALVRRKAEMQAQVAALKEQRVDMGIWEHELKVWAEGLERQQIAIEQAQEELRMLTQTQVPVTGPGAALREDAPDPTGEVLMVKNVKRLRDGAKLPK